MQQQPLPTEQASADTAWADGWLDRLLSPAFVQQAAAEEASASTPPATPAPRVADPPLPPTSGPTAQPPDPNPNPNLEREAQDAVREHGRVEVHVRNVITRPRIQESKAAYERHGGGGFVESFTDLDAARRFADQHRTYFNNCAVEVSFLLRYEIAERTRYEPDTVGLMHRHPVLRQFRDEVWRTAPGWNSERPEWILLGPVIESGASE